MLILLALACLLASSIWSAIERSCPLMLLAAGLALYVLGDNTFHLTED